MGEEEEERACDGQLIEGQRKKREEEKHIIHGECDEAEYRRTFDTTEHIFINGVSLHSIVHNPGAPVIHKSFHSRS